MSINRSATLEVFFDYGHDKQGFHETLPAVEYIGSLVPDLDVLNIGRYLRIGRNQHATTINPTEVNWPRLKAEINVLVTPRKIAWERQPEVDPDDPSIRTVIKGLSIQRPFPLPQIAVVKADTSYGTTSIFVHEVGHLFRLKRDGITKAPQSDHCLLDHCVMAEEVQITTVKYSVKPQPDDKKVVEVSAPKSAAHAYCTECTDQLKQVAHYRSQYRTGKYIPPIFT